MANLFSKSSIKQLFLEIYRILKETDLKVTEIWFEIAEIRFFKNFNNSELLDFIKNFDFISVEKSNFINYIVINKIAFIIDCFKYLEFFDIHKLSNLLLDYDGFEALIKAILLENNYRVTKNFRFSDRSNFKTETSQKRYEIDVIGIYQNYVLIIDAKQWKKKDSYSSINKAASLQLQRAIALKKNPETFSNLICTLLEKTHKLQSKLPFILIPLMVTLEDNSIKISEKSIPLVGIYHFNSFLQELRENLSYFNTLKVKKIFIQTQLF